MLKPENSLLIVIDFQGNLAQAMDNKESLFENAQKIIKGAKVFGIPIVATEHVPTKLGPTIPVIAQHLDGLTVISKESFSCLGNDLFASELGRLGRKQVIMTGIETHICVYQTAVDLLAMGYEVHVVADGVSSSTARNYELGIARMRDEGAKICSAEMVLFELLGTARSVHFRDIIQIVK